MLRRILIAMLMLVLGSAVLGSAATASAAGRVREYWIAAVPVTWNVVTNRHDAIGRVSYLAADTVFPTVVYRRYTQQWRRVLPNVSGGSSNQDLIPGPLIHARVGDHILVHFKNLDMLYSRPHSMHFHGVHYAPSSDGAYLPGFSGAAPPSSPATRSPTEPRERASWFHSIVRSRLAWP